MHHEFRKEEGNHFPNIVFISLLFIGIILITLFGFHLSGIILVLVLFLELAFYMGIVVLLAEPKKVKHIVDEIVRIEERAVVQEVPVIREHKVTETVYVDRPVEKQVIVEKPVYYEKEREKLNIHRFNFVGSSETKVYHTRNCRLGKSIKKKYKVSNDSERFFVNRNFNPCKICILKTKKS